MNSNLVELFQNQDIQVLHLPRLINVSTLDILKTQKGAQRSCVCSTAPKARQKMEGCTPGIATGSSAVFIKGGKFYNPSFELSDFSNPPSVPFSALLILNLHYICVTRNSRCRLTGVTGESKVTISQACQSKYNDVLLFFSG